MKTGDSTKAICAHCKLPRAVHGRFARCEGGATQFEPMEIMNAPVRLTDAGIARVQQIAETQHDKALGMLCLRALAGDEKARAELSERVLEP